METIVKRKEDLINAKKKICKEYEFKIEKLNKYINVVEKSSINKEDEIDTIVFKLYMQLDNVSKVAIEVNKLGFRIPTNSRIGERKYSSNDITAILTNKDSSVENDLKESAQEIQKMNYGKVAKRWF